MLHAERNVLRAQFGCLGGIERWLRYQCRNESNSATWAHRRSRRRHGLAYYGHTSLALFELDLELPIKLMGIPFPAGSDSCIP